MRATLVVVLWLLATSGVVYVANTAVELVDLQVFPGGSRIEGLSLPEHEEPLPVTTPSIPATVTPPSTTTGSMTTLAPASAVAPASTTEAPPTTLPPTTLPATDNTGDTVEFPTTTVVATTLPPTTTQAPAPTITQAPAPTTTQAPAPTTTQAPALSLMVSTASLPEARIGENYQMSLEASGGMPPYSWNLSAGSLPAGLGLSVEGVLGGIPSATADALLVFTVTDADGRLAASPTLAFATAPDRRTVVARGGTVFIDSAGDSVSLFLVSPAAGYSAVIVDPGGFRVEVQFVPLQGDATSWVVCEVADGVACTHG